MHATWLTVGLAVGFGVSYVFADLLDVPRDLYHGIYLAVVGVFLAAWMRATGERIGPMIRRNWQLTSVLSVAAIALLAVMVTRTDDPTPRPQGLELVAAVAWRGVLYGVADGLFLSAFPILAVFAATRDSRLRTHWIGTAVVGLAALVASLMMTAAYHLGYSDFRSDKLAKPLAGDLVWSAPTLLTLNPVGAAIAHAGLHVTAVLHSYETEVFLPPHR